MSRQPRKYIIAPGAAYHIVARGNNEKKIFRRVRDYKKLLRIIQDTKKQKPFYFYSYSLMPNHYHLEIETIDLPISEIMHNINFLYALHFKQRYKTSGHLFQDRFFSALIDKDSYFWKVARYIELNSVKAGLSEQPEKYRWASFQFYFHKEYNENLVDRERFLKLYGGGNNLEEIRLSYIQFIKGGKNIEQIPSFITKKLV